MPSKSVLIAQAFSKTGVLSTIVDSAPSVNTGQVDVATSADLPNTGNDVGDQAFVRETNRLYIWSGSGWYNIALINTTPTWDSGGQPLATYVLDIDSPQDATVITLAASDPEGIPITYTYVTSGQMDSISTISQDSSVFTITPKTIAQVPDGGTGSITFRASDGINILPSVSSFTLNFITGIENSKYTTLLAKVTDTSDNNNITDSSTNNHTITVAGDAHAGTFSPYRSRGYSWDFEGAGFYTNDAGHGESIEAENTASAFNVGTNDYSVEGWFKERNSGTYSTNANARLFDLGPNDNISLMRNYPNTGGKKLLLKENATVIITSTNDVFDGNWHFIQVIRTGGYTKLYVDGTEEGSIASTTNINAISKIIVGAWSDYSYGFDGQIADFRFSNTARTAAVPLRRLTSDSNTKLLVCSKPYLVDESGTATSLTLLKSANGTRDYPDAVAFSPFDYDEYSAADHGGSVYFDGTGDALRIADNSNIQLGTSPFTIEGWFYCTDTAPTQGILAKRDGSSEYWRWIIAGGNLNFRFQSTGLGSFTCNTVTIPSNTWCHFAVTRDNNNDVRQFVNGISTQSAINSTGNFDISGASLRVGEYELNTGHFNGYISDIKIVKNSALYTSNFTSPTAPLSSSGTSLHIKGTDASIIDKSQGSNLNLVGNTTGSTTQVKFANTKSMYFDGTGDYIDTNKNLQGDFGTGDFTVEGWFYLNEAIGATRVLLGSGTSDSNDEFILVLQSNGTLYYDWFDSPSWIASASTITAYTWHHIAVTRSGTQLDLWLDGTSVASNSSHSHNYNGTSTFKIGMSRVGTYFWNGYIQDVRITNGLARYTANFTPPTASLEG